MCSASMPAASSSSAGLPECGMPCTARRTCAAARRRRPAPPAPPRRGRPPASGPPRRRSPPCPAAAQRLDVDRLHRVAVDHAGADAVIGELVRRLSASCTVIPAADDRHVVALRRAHDLAPADRELLVRPVDDRRVGAGRAHVRDPVQVGHRPHELRGLVRRRTGRARCSRGPRATRRGPRAPSATARLRRSRRPRASRRASGSRG